MKDINIGFIGLGNLGKNLANSILLGGYKLFIHDLNKNKKWDTGNIKTLKGPEEIYFFKDSIKIRANWELNLNINI